MIGPQRIGVPNFSFRAFREGVANALIHRDYTRLGAVHVQWHNNRIEISNVGGFPEGVHLGNLLVTPPRPRNLLLTDAFKRVGIVERTARGIDTIFFEQLRNGRPAPSYERSTQTDVVLVLPGGRPNLAFVRLVVEENQAESTLSLDDLLILNHLWMDSRLTPIEATLLAQKPEAEIRAILEQMVARGLVEARGKHENRFYHLSASTCRRLGEASTYVRMRGFESLQQEQVLLEYVQKHGRITRRELAELCKIGQFQAGRLLKRMVDSGQLKLQGTGRGAHYTKRME